MWPLWDNPAEGGQLVIFPVKLRSVSEKQMRVFLLASLVEHVNDCGWWPCLG